MGKAPPLGAVRKARNLKAFVLAALLLCSASAVKAEKLDQQRVSDGKGALETVIPKGVQQPAPPTIMGGKQDMPSEAWEPFKRFEPEPLYQGPAGPRDPSYVPLPPHLRLKKIDPACQSCVAI